jgi:hypothetical protein
MGLRLNEEVEVVASAPITADSTATKVIRSTWMT